MQEEHPEMNFYYLNCENTWRGCGSAGLDLLENGNLRLAALPRLAGMLPSGVEDLPVPLAPAGLAADPCGAVYYTLPDGARIGQIEPCQGQALAAACLPGQGTLPGWLNQARGMVYHPRRKALFVADGLNSRIQAFDPATWQVLDIWGRAGEPGAAPWNLKDPRAVAVDGRGSLYAVDGQSGLVKFDLLGQPLVSFGKQAQSTAGLQQPVGVAVGRTQGQERVFVVDAGPCRVAIFDLDGRCLAIFGEGVLERPLAITADGAASGDSTIFIGDNQLGQVLTFKPARPGSGAYSFSGPAAGYRGPVAALVVDAQERLWVHPGAAYAAGEDFRPLMLDPDAASAHSGVLWSGPLGMGKRSHDWSTLQTRLNGLGEGAHAQFFVYSGDDRANPPPPPDPGAAQPFSDPWLPLPLDADAGVIPMPAPAQPKPASAQRGSLFLWVGVHLTGDGAAGPVLSQIQVRYDHIGYRQYLPAMFGRDPAQADLLDRLLGLFESYYGEAEQSIAGLDTLFDPQAAPAGWLSWLAQWLALNLDEDWPVSQQRALVAEALIRYRQRGTADGLRRALREFAGVDALIIEPIQSADFLALGGGPDPSVGQLLGSAARLAAAPPEGAVLGDALLDASTLSGEDDMGRELFGSLAHRFTVQVYRGQIRDESDLERVRAVIEREKPAHTLYDLAVIEPAMRVGYQSTVGVDTLVAGPPGPGRTGDTTNRDLVLGGNPPGQLGERSELGKTTRLNGTTNA